MRRAFLTLLAIGLLAAAPVWAAYNPFFPGGHRNQFSVHVGKGNNHGWLVPPPSMWVPFAMVHLQYSQPTTFFRLPARQSLGVVQTVGWGSKYRIPWSEPGTYWNWKNYSIPIAVLGKDVILHSNERWYYGAGISVGMQAQENERIGSKLVFGFKLLAGRRLTDTLSLEFIIQHFSNGNTAPENNSYAFYGIGLAWNF